MLSPLKEPSIANAPQATQSVDQASEGSPVPKKKSKAAPFLTKAFFNTVAPGLASFAQTQKSELDIVVEEDDDEEEDPDVIAMMADF